jgi:two-component system cell cycle sensor histidine kinase/response regulator CckA
MLSDSHKQTQEALRQSEEKYRNLFDYSNDGIIIHDLEGKIIDVNQRALHQFGYSKPEFLSLSIQDLHPPQALKASKAAFETIPQHGVVRFEIDFKKENGDIFPAEVSSSLFKIGGKPVIQSIVRDITQRKQAQQALRESQEGFLTILDSIEARIYVADLETDEILFINRQMRDDFGDNIVGEPCWKIFYNESGPCTVCPIDKLLDADGNPTTGCKWEGQNSLGSKYYVNYCRAIKWVDGRLARLQVGMDITERKRLGEQLRQAQKMEAVGRLAGGVAHDFNNLLTSMCGFAELMRLQLRPDDPLQELLEKILGSGNRAADLVRQLLAFSRKQIIQPRVLDLNQVVAEMNRMLQRIIGEDIQMETILAPGLWSVRVDPARIEQVIVNLAVNARDAMPNGGRLVIETANVVLDKTNTLFENPALYRDFAPSLEATAERPETGSAEYVLLSVSDTGIGMSEKVKAHLFEPFFTTKQVGEGSGLGLSTVYGVVKQSQGAIQVDSEEGQGTSFKIYLPRTMERPISQARVAQSDDLPRGTETVLLVEDESAVRELAAYVLRRQGYTVLEAANGEEALSLAQKHGTAIDLLLTDVVMPHMSGKELADQLEALYPNIHILFTSGYTDETIDRHGVPIPNVDFIQKPFSPTTLAHQVRDALKRRGNHMPDNQDNHNRLNIIVRTGL